MLIFWSVVFVKFNRVTISLLVRTIQADEDKSTILLYFRESKGKEFQKHAFILNLSS